MLIAMAVHDTVENERTWMTEETLLSLAETVDWNKHRLVISDNGSCKETLELYPWALEVFPFGSLALIYNGENIGTAAAINEAWRYRNPGEHAVKMDDDVHFHQSGWADWMEGVFDRDPAIGIVGLKRNDLAESTWAKGDMKSTLTMLPHRRGERWLVVEEVTGVIGTCVGFSSKLLEEIGYLTQPGVYGFDDSLASIRARIAGYKRVFLCGFEIDHLDPGGDAYCQWKIDQADEHLAAFNTEVLLLETGGRDVYYDGGFDR